MAELKYIETKNDTMYGLYVDFDEEHEIKQFGKKVWFDGLKIYDFDLKVGDSLTIQNYDGSIEKYLIDSIQTKFIYGKTRTVQYASSFVIMKVLVLKIIVNFPNFFSIKVSRSLASIPQEHYKFIKFEDEIENLN
ncbi:MAG: hypothetical protein IPL23_31205 [Saprospiraceae bacterium]|nr:hypothetical protein [Saprospiraceae bacterium]